MKRRPFLLFGAPRVLVKCLLRDRHTTRTFGGVRTNRKDWTTTIPSVERCLSRDSESYWPTLGRYSASLQNLYNPSGHSKILEKSGITENKNFKSHPLSLSAKRGNFFKKRTITKQAALKRSERLAYFKYSSIIRISLKFQAYAQLVVQIFQ